MRTLIVGDLHLKERLGYADFIPDGREAEKKKVLDFIHKLSKDCDRVVFLGDQLNGRNNSSEVIREFVSYIERFKGEIFIIAGNHEKTGDGKSAIDFMKEISNKKWHIITNEIFTLDGNVFCPYFYKGELECSNNKDAAEKLMGMLPKGTNLFIHHAVSGYNLKSIKTDDLNEIVLPKKSLSAKYDRIVCGHIHTASRKITDKVLYTGSVFTNEVNEIEKFVYTLEDNVFTEHVLPVRSIIKLENPTVKELENTNINSIIKVILSEKISEEELESIKGAMVDFDGSVLIEDFKIERKVIKFADGELDLDIMSLMKIYATERKLDFEKIKAGYELIKA